MKKILCPLLILLPLLGCGQKLKMPEVKIPEIKMLQPEKPDAQIRKHIALVVKSHDDIRFHRNLANLLQRSRKLNWDSPRLLADVLAYHPQLKGDDQMTRYQRLLQSLQIPRSAVIDVAATRLERADAREAELCRTLLNSAAPPDPRGPADFSQFAPYLAARQAQLPERLILWMYDRDPAGAMQQLATLYPNQLSPDDARTLTVATRVLDQLSWKERQGLSKPGDPDPLASEQLDKLSRLDPWWVRLYVAHMLARHPQLATPDLTTRLRTDANPLVTKTLHDTSKR